LHFILTIRVSVFGLITWSYNSYNQIIVIHCSHKEMELLRPNAVRRDRRECTWTGKCRPIYYVSSHSC